MNIYIVDASVAAKWFIEEEHNSIALHVLSENNKLHAPEFFLLEMDSIFCKWIRRSIITLEEGNDIRSALRQFPIQYHPLQSILDSAFAIANLTHRSIYDCLYIALAVLLKGKMITADQRLHNIVSTTEFAKHVVWIGDLG